MDFVGSDFEMLIFLSNQENHPTCTAPGVRCCFGDFGGSAPVDFHGMLFECILWGLVSYPIHGIGICIYLHE